MPRGDRGPMLVPSVLDRLLDDQPGAPESPLARRSQSVQDLERSVARDLEDLLNTRREMLDDLPVDYVEVARSLLNYGPPDFTTFSLLGEKDRAQVRSILEETISNFEPRLTGVRVTLEPSRAHDKSLRFRVNALLRIDPTPEPVTFDTVWRIETQQYQVQGHE